MVLKNRKKLLKFLLIGGFSTVIFVLLYEWVFLSFTCDAMQGICVMSSFLIQAPAHFFTIFIENIFNATLTSNQIRLVFIVVIPLFWFIIGLFIGYILYFIKTKHKK